MFLVFVPFSRDPVSTRYFNLKPYGPKASPFHMGTFFFLILHVINI